MTLSDIYTQQVLNNLAKSINDPYALPFFAFPNQGTTAIQDTGTVGGPGNVTPNWLTSPFGIGANRQATENWVLVPVSDPAKLALMQCAYQQAISSCTGIDYGMSCPNCNKLRLEFHGAKGPKDANCPEAIDLPCLSSHCCWLCWGSKKDVPKDCCPPYVGCYGSVYVWVPVEGRAVLNELTLAVLDYAVNDAIQFKKRTKTVELYLDETGKLVKDGDSGVKKITADIPIDQPSEAVVELELYSEFLRQYGNDIADKLVNIATEAIMSQYEAQLRDLEQQGRNEIRPDKKEFLQRRIRETQKLISDPTSVTRTILLHAYWDNPPEDLLKGVTDPTEFNRLKKAIEYVKRHKLVPGSVPKAHDLLHGPALYERTGASSEGLQKRAEQLKAASGLK